MAITELTIHDLTTQQMVSVTKFVTTVNMSWTMDAVSQMTVEISDPNLAMFKSNYFMVRRMIVLGLDSFEIATVEVSQGEGSAAKIRLECRRIQSQAMKRDKTPEAYSGVTATDYAQIVANRFGLGFVGEPTTTKRSITKSSGPTSSESVWTVLTRLASAAQFQVFESDNTLYFASMEWLLGKWGNVVLTWPRDSTSAFYVLEIPTCRRSDDDPLQGEVRVLLRRSATTMALRPGMTVTLAGMGEFDQQYLISEVAYAVGVPDPIGIACRTPVKKVLKK